MIHDKFGRLLTKTKKTIENMYKLKIKISELCNLINEDNNEAWQWHKRFCHHIFYTLRDVVKGNFVRGLPKIQNPEEICASCILGKHSKTPFFHQN